ncbi:MAG: ComF family protein [Clostridia bacterium]|nr:ComF family protein [Clostridia bacterium]
MYKLIDMALDFVFPPVCGICGKIGDEYICKSCKKNIQRYSKNTCNFVEEKYFKEHFWLFEYKGEIRNMIINYKFHDKSYLHRTFSDIITDNSVAVEYIKKYDYIIPVPIHNKRKMERGYNQCYLIAKTICKKIGNIKCNNILVKNKNICKQSSLNREKRHSNVIGAFSVKKNVILSNKKILIFDDVYTTGSTVNECSKVIRSLGCNHIDVITIAKD